MSYERMAQVEARLTAEVAALLAQADAADVAEDALYGGGQQPSDLLAELRHREGRLAKIREAKAVLARETAKARAAKFSEQVDELCCKAVEPTTSPQQREAWLTRAAQHDQQAAELDGNDPEPPAADHDLPCNAPPTNP